MKKIITLLLGLFVAGLAAFAVPNEIKIKPVKVDKVIKMFVVAENHAVTIDAVNSDVVEVTSDELTDVQVQPALHSEIFRLEERWEFRKTDYFNFDYRKPTRYYNRVRQPTLFRKLLEP